MVRGERSLGSSSVESETSIETDREWSEGEEKSQASECSGR